MSKHEVTEYIGLLALLILSPGFESLRFIMWVERRTAADASVLKGLVLVLASPFIVTTDLVEESPAGGESRNRPMLLYRSLPNLIFKG